MPHQQTKQKKILFELAAHTLKKQDQLLTAFGQKAVGEFGENRRNRESRGALEFFLGVLWDFQ